MKSLSRREFLKNISLYSAVFLLGPENILEAYQATSRDAPEYRLVANVPDFKLVLYKNGQREKEYEVRVGMPLIFRNILGDTRTPLGEYKILNKTDWDGPFAGSWMQFKKNPDSAGKDQGGWGIHGSPHKEFVGHALSKGCLALVPEEAEELKKTVPVGTPLSNIYEPLKLSDETLEMCTDFYSLMGDVRKNVLEILPFEEKFISGPKLKKVLEEAEKRKGIYIRALNELYRKYIRPLHENRPHPDLLEKNPEISSKYLKAMSENKKLVVPVEELLI
jgi:hypothetical protein